MNNSMPSSNESMPEAASIQRTEFYPSGTLTYARQLTDEECIIDWQKDASVDHSAVALYELRNIKVWTDIQAICVYDDVHGIYENLSLIDDSFDFSRVQNTPIQEVADPMALFPHLDPHNFYHWLIDTLPCVGVMELAGRKLADLQHLYIHRMDSGFQQSTLDQLDFPRSKVIAFDGHPKHFHVAELLMPLFRLDGAFWPHPWGMEYLKDFYLAQPNTKTPEPGASRPEQEAAGRKVYVARGKARRTVENEVELMETLAAMGYEIMSPENLSLSEQARMLSQADCVLGSHGAGLANISFCKPGTRVLEFGGHYITTHFRIVSELNKLDYRAIAAGMDSEGNRLSTTYEGELRNEDYQVDIPHVVECAETFFAD